MRTGHVILVGAGPGDPGLLTLRAAEWLRRAEVVLVDRLVDRRIVEMAPSSAEIIEVGKRPNRHPIPQAAWPQQTGRAGSEALPQRPLGATVWRAHGTQREINELLVSRARAGKLVVRLKGGDPFVFGRGGEEAEALVAAGVPFEVVPGVTAGLCGLAYAGIPVTHRGLASSVALITGHEDPLKDESAVDLGALAAGAQTLVFYMGVGRLDAIAEALLRHGRPPQTPAALIQWATTPRQKTITATLTTLAQEARRAGVQSPALIVVGEVVRLREKLRWFDVGPLFGKRVLVTRSRAQASALSDLLRARGAEPIELPLIRIEPPESFEPLDQAISQLRRYHYVLFTSVNGVAAFFERLQLAGCDARALGGAKLAAIGPATAEALTAHGLQADIVPEQAQQAGLLAALQGEPIAGARFLLPRAAAAPDVLPHGLRQRGATVDVVPAYRTVQGEAAAEQLRALLETDRVDVVTFASPSTVKHFAGLLGHEAQRLAGRAAVACIGPVTAAAAREAGLRVDIEALEHTIPALVQAIADYFARRHPERV